MAQKIKPISLRTGITKNWSSRWFPSRGSFKAFLAEDEIIRKIIKGKINNAGIDRIDIERAGDKYKIIIRAARSGLIIGRGGKGVEELTRDLEKALLKFRQKENISGKLLLNLTIDELKRMELSANVLAQNIAWDLEKRMPFRRTMKKYLDQIIANKGVLGAKIKMSGRLDGTEIARTEQLSRGRLPLQTLRADIDYGEATAFTTYGTIGIKVWIYKGEIFQK